jgi:nitroreductase
MGDFSLEQTQSIEQAITSRHSVRAFLPTPIETTLIEKILTIASQAPSGTNTQPWQVYVLTGETKKRVSDQILSAYHTPSERDKHQDEYDYYPKTWKSPYIDRRRQVGWDLYGLLGIQKENKEAMHQQHARNYTFFDAPVGLIFTIDRIMGQGSWLDYGMFLQNIMIAARAHNLHTCAQASFCQYHRIIAKELSFSPDEMLVCGMALGFEDTSKIENRLRTSRVETKSFARFFD